MAGKPIARLGDPGSHGGSISTGSSPIFVNSLPIACVGDTYACPIHGPNPITTGAPHALGLGKYVAHVDSRTACGASIIAGSPDTFVGTADASPINDIFSEFLKEKTFLEFQLLNDREQPIANEKFMLTLPDGRIINGMLDDTGRVHLPNVPRGTCKINFPELEDMERL